MEITFSIKYHEKNELRVSLSTFSKESLGAELSNQLGNVELVDVTLFRQSGDLRANWNTLNRVVVQIGRILHENPDCIFYYYCDEINPIPKMRDSHDLTPAEYRNRLFSILFRKGASLFPKDCLIDDLITIETEQGVAYIHLIYRSNLTDKASIIKEELNKLAQK